MVTPATTTTPVVKYHYTGFNFKLFSHNTSFSRGSHMDLKSLLTLPFFSYTFMVFVITQVTEVFWNIKINGN